MSPARGREREIVASGVGGWGDADLSVEHLQHEVHPALCVGKLLVSCKVNV